MTSSPFHCTVNSVDSTPCHDHHKNLQIQLFYKISEKRREASHVVPLSPVGAAQGCREYTYSVSIYCACLAISFYIVLNCPNWSHEFVCILIFFLASEKFYFYILWRWGRVFWAVGSTAREEWGLCLRSPCPLWRSRSDNFTTFRKRLQPLFSQFEILKKSL